MKSDVTKPQAMPMTSRVATIEKLRFGSMFVLKRTIRPMPAETSKPESIAPVPSKPSVHKSAIATLAAQFGMRPTIALSKMAMFSFDFKKSPSASSPMNVIKNPRIKLMIKTKIVT